MEIAVNVNLAGDEKLTLATIIGERQNYYNPMTDEVGTEPLTLGMVVAERLADKLWSRVDATDAIELTRRVVQIRDEVIREHVEPLIREAIEAAAQKTNEYGEPTGKPTTLRSLIMDTAKGMLGKRDNYGRGPRLLDVVVREATEAAMRAELQATVDAEKAKIVAVVRTNAAKVLGDAVRASF